jgi:hypothetical protein
MPVCGSGAPVWSSSSPVMRPSWPPSGRNATYPVVQISRASSNRANAQERKRESQTGTTDLFAGHQANVREETIDEIVSEQMRFGSENLITILEADGARSFSSLLVPLLQAFMLRETNVKDICVELAKSGKIENTWGGGNRKPRDEHIIKLKISAK